jgi:hypothetical protein
MTQRWQWQYQTPPRLVLLVASASMNTMMKQEGLNDGHQGQELREGVQHRGEEEEEEEEEGESTTASFALHRRRRLG